MSDPVLTVVDVRTRPRYLKAFFYGFHTPSEDLMEFARQTHWGMGHLGPDQIVQDIRTGRLVRDTWIVVPPGGPDYRYLGEAQFQREFEIAQDNPEFDYGSGGCI